MIDIMIIHPPSPPSAISPIRGILHPRSHLPPTTHDLVSYTKDIQSTEYTHITNLGKNQQLQTPTLTDHNPRL